MTIATLFRPEALENLRMPEQIGQGLRLVAAPYRATILLLAAGLAAAAAATAVVSVPVTVRADGMILYSRATLEATVFALHDGALQSIAVRPGDRVSLGDVVAYVAQPAIEHDLRLARDENQAAREHLSRFAALQAESLRILAPLHQHLATEAQDSILRLQQRQAELERLAKNNDGLRASGTITIDRYLQIRSQLTDALEAIGNRKAALLTVQVERTEKEAQFTRELLASQERVAQTDRQVARLTEQLATSSAISAAQGGVVSEVKLSPGDLVRFNSPVIGLVPAPDAGTEDRLVATALLPLALGKRVTADMAAFVEPASVRRDVFGEIRGRVVSVSATPATPERLRNLLRNDELVRKAAENGPAFLATIMLEPDPATPSGYAWTSSRGPAQKLSAGTPLQVEVQTERVTLAGLLLPALRELLRGERTP